MSACIDPVGELTWTQVLASKSHATNNVASTGVDISNYVGTIACHVNIGVKTAGDNDGAVNVVIQASATNSAAAATNIVGATTNYIGTTNNTAASGEVRFDTRAEYKFLFARVILSGTNSPAYPLSVTAAGLKRSV